MYRYPLNLSFKTRTPTPQIAITDAADHLLLYVRQKPSRLKETITVFADREQTRPLYTINADRVLDISARYHFREAHSGRPLGSVKRRGMKPLWRARYDIYDNGTPTMTIREQTPWGRLLNGTLASLPLLGHLSRFASHPTYTVSRADGTEAMRLSKRPSLLEGKFRLDRLTDLSPAAETRVLLSLLLLLLLERARG